MKINYINLKIFTLIFLLSFTFITEIHSQQNTNFDGIFENGERFMFRTANGSLKSYIVLTLNEKSVLIVISRTDTVHNIINGIWFMEQFTDNYKVPSWASGTGKDEYIIHITNDIYRIGNEYMRKVKAPQGFWSNAFLDIGL